MGLELTNCEKPKSRMLNWLSHPGAPKTHSVNYFINNGLCTLALLFSLGGDFSMLARKSSTLLRPHHTLTMLVELAVCYRVCRLAQIKMSLFSASSFYAFIRVGLIQVCCILLTPWLFWTAGLTFPLSVSSSLAMKCNMSAVIVLHILCHLSPATLYHGLKLLLKPERVLLLILSKNCVFPPL